MKHRKAIWATTAALLVLSSTLYISATSPTQLTAKAAIWTLACLTCPIALAHHYPLGLYVVLLANAATYALVGVLVAEPSGNTTKPPFPFNFTLDSTNEPSWHNQQQH